MKQSYELKTEQSQKLALTPGLIQAIQLLQLNATQLESHIQEQLLSNPMLEIDDAADAERRAKRAEEGERAGEDWAQYMRDIPAAASYSFAAEEYEPQIPAASITLAEHLCRELELSGLAEDLLKTASYIAACLDEDGYLRVSLAEIGERSGAKAQLVREALFYIQGMEPAGIGARNLSECLEIQLKRMGPEAADALKLVKNNLEDIAANRISAIAEQWEMEPERVQAACDIIKTLEPRPGRLFSESAAPRYIRPDIMLEKRGEEFVPHLNEGNYPSLTLSPTYRKLLSHPDSDEELKDYINKKMDAAMWLIRSIDQRRRTILSVSSAIIDIQGDFFAALSEFPAPMRLADVAKIAGVHESTVSRCCSGKYMQTPRGLFDMKALFSAEIPSARGQGVTAAEAKKRIRECIDTEDERSPYSDQQLSDLLRRRWGIDISRRTVAKYREAEAIASSSGRRRY